MLGQRLKLAALAALTMLTASVSAHAADYTQPYQPPPPPVIIQQPPHEELGNNWYLRGQIGVGMVESDKMQYEPNAASPATDFAFDTTSLGDAVFIGGGVGYDWNNWLRFDVTGEYRSKAHIDAFGSYTTGCTGAGGSPCIDTYTGSLKSWVFLANAYVDLGTWYCFTPFVGGGIGGAYNELVDFNDVNVSTGTGRGIGQSSGNWSFAWALYGGVSYNISDNLKLDLSYRYLNYGSASASIDCVGGCNPDSYKLDNLHSNDFMLGLRWTCCDLGPPPPRYVYRPPPPAYVPPQPPISSRG